jgi:hypothetical protein
VLLRAFRFAREVDSSNQRAAHGWSEQTTRHADGRRFAGAVGADQSEDFDLRNGEGEVVDGKDVVVVLAGRASFIFDVHGRRGKV